METVTLDEFRERLAEHIALVTARPLEIVAARTEQRAALVSAEFFDRAMLALEDAADLTAVAEARRNTAPGVPLNPCGKNPAANTPLHHAGLVMHHAQGIASPQNDAP